MPLTLTSTAYSALPKVNPSGVDSVSFNLTSAAAVTFCASANATVILGPRIPAGSTILDIAGFTSSGAATAPVDIGIEASLSKFASQVTAGERAWATKTTLPYKVTVSDDAINQFKTVKFGVTPGTNTAVVQCSYTVYFTRDPGAGSFN
jgi:hypothetical protein